MRSFAGMKQVPLRDRGTFNMAFLLEHYFPTSRAIKKAKAGARLRIADRLRRAGGGKVAHVERLPRISPKEFRRRFLANGTPVIIEGAVVDWPLARRWSFDQFKQRYGTETIKLVQRKGLSDDDFVDRREFSEEIGFGEFLDQVLSGGRKYMRFSPLLEKFPELRQDFDHDFFREMCGNGWGLTYQLFIGASGTYTPLHNAMTGFFFVNVFGTKRWTLIPNHYLAVLNPSADGFGYNHSAAEVDLSNLEQFPGFDCIDRMEAVIQPGDILFVPSWMWHCVRNESPTIGVRCGFVYPTGMLRESSTLSFIRLFAARNPSTLEALYYVLFKTNLPERDKWLVTAGLIRK